MYYVWRSFRADQSFAWSLSLDPIIRRGQICFRSPIILLPWFLHFLISNLYLYSVTSFSNHQWRPRRKACTTDVDVDALGPRFRVKVSSFLFFHSVVLNVLRRVSIVFVSRQTNKHVLWYIVGSGPDSADPAPPWNRRQEQKIDFSVFRSQSACTVRICLLQVVPERPYVASFQICFRSPIIPRAHTADLRRFRSSFHSMSAVCSILSYSIFQTWYTLLCVRLSANS